MPLSDEAIARVVHEANSALQREAGDMVPGLPWDSETPQQRASILAAVRAVRYGGVTSPALMHEAWCGYKRREGWVYGPEKDFEKKTHPCLVDYGQLPAEQRVKDGMCIAIVTQLAQA